MLVGAERLELSRLAAVDFESTASTIPPRALAATFATLYTHPQ